MEQKKSNINPQILQQMLESSPNAAEKGQSQFFTPHPFGAALAAALPRDRPTIVDLNCGAGWLLQASANDTTKDLLGSDIDPCKAAKVDRPALRGEAGSQREPAHLPVNRLTHDLTLLYPLLREVEWEADLFVLNPPWRLWWYRDRLKDLAHSEVDAVREAFAQQEEGAYKKDTVDGTIDSTIATLMMALDRCSYLGEGVLIGNNATLERLIFTPGAPHAALAKHIWAHVVVPGNPMTGIEDCLWEKETDFATGVIYFARAHEQGPQKYQWPQMPDRALRHGSVMRHLGMATRNSVLVWDAVKDQLALANGKAAIHPWNLWLSVSGRIRTNLSLFEERSVKVNKKEAERLHALNGQTPMELVLQRAARDELMHVVERGGWKVEPALVEAVRVAVAQYHAARAPLYPLPDIQRLGYLDEQDWIECKQDLLGVPPSKADDEEPKSGRANLPVRQEKAKGVAAATPYQLIFQAGQRYSIRTQTVSVERKSKKFNPLASEFEDLAHSGQELAIYISDGLRSDSPAKDANDDLTEYVFMDAKIKADKQTKVEVGKKVRRGYTYPGETVTIDFTLQELAEHFIIPDVPDVAQANPAGYRKHLDTLAELEKITEQLCTA
jgi:predicted RNA methylase